MTLALNQVHSTLCRLQDDVQSFLESVLPYERFALRLPKCEIPQLDRVLRSISTAEVARLQVRLPMPRSSACVVLALQYALSLCNSTSHEDNSVHRSTPSVSMLANSPITISTKQH